MDQAEEEMSWLADVEKYLQSRGTQGSVAHSHTQFLWAWAPLWIMLCSVVRGKSSLFGSLLHMTVV